MQARMKGVMNLSFLKEELELREKGWDDLAVHLGVTRRTMMKRLRAGEQYASEQVARAMRLPLSEFMRPPIPGFKFAPATLKRQSSKRRPYSGPQQRALREKILAFIETYPGMYNRREAARRLNVTAPRFNRAFAQLQQQGVVKLDEHKRMALRHVTLPEDTDADAAPVG